MPAKRLLWMCLPLVVILVSGCMPEATLRSELFLDDRSLVSGEPCAAPCWNGITPGETLWADAVAAVQNDPAFSGFETNTEDGMMQGVWQKAGSNQFCCRLLAKEEDGVISYVFLAISPGTILDDVLKVHGDPDYVTTFDFTNSESVVQLVYPDVPMVVSVVVGDSNASLLANSDVVAVLYMAPDEMQLVVETSDLQAWAGFQAYKAYQSATPVITPMYTLTPPPGS